MGDGGVGVAVVWRPGTHAAGTNGASVEVVALGYQPANGGGSRVGDTGAELLAGRLKQLLIRDQLIGDWFIMRRYEPGGGFSESGR